MWCNSVLFICAGIFILLVLLGAVAGIRREKRDYVRNLEMQVGFWQQKYFELRRALYELPEDHTYYETPPDDRS
jgi:hypothetical protein